MKKFSIRKRNHLRKKNKKSMKQKRKNIRKKKTVKRNRRYRKKSMKRGGGSCCGNYPLSGGNGNNLGPVGYSWKGGNINTWPGVKGVDNMSNHFPVSKNGITPGGVDPALPTNTTMQRGGFLQDLVNLGRYVEYDNNSMINGLKGVTAPVNPMPYNDQPIDEKVSIITTEPVDLNQVYLDANNYVGKL